MECLNVFGDLFGTIVSKDKIKVFFSKFVNHNVRIESYS